MRLGTSWGRIIEPRWFRSLELDPDLRKRVRYEVESLRLNDQTMPSRTFGRLPGAKDDEAARAAERRIDLGGRWRFRLAVGLLGGPLLLMLLLDPLEPLRATLPGGGAQGWGDVVLTIVAVFLFQATMAWISLRWLVQPAMTPYYATILRRHGTEVCGHCGHLRATGGSAAVCVECGRTDPLPPVDGSDGDGRG